MFGLFGPKEDWRLVYTITLDVKSTLSQKEGKLYFHFFESNKGNRKVEYESTISNDRLEEKAKKFSEYHEKVYPWLKGRLDPDIPRYSQIPEEETAVMLRGKKV